MAVSPQTLERNLANEVKAFEEIIDKILINKKIYKGDGVQIVCPSGMTSKHFLLIKQAYLRAGWVDIVLTSDRDVDCLIFKY